MRKEIEIMPRNCEFDFITDTFTGADGGGAFVQTKALYLEMRRRAEAGDKAAAKVTEVFRAVARFIRVACEEAGVGEDASTSNSSSCDGSDSSGNLAGERGLESNIQTQQPNQAPEPPQTKASAVSESAIPYDVLPPLPAPVPDLSKQPYTELSSVPAGLAFTRDGTPVNGVLPVRRVVPLDDVSVPKWSSEHPVPAIGARSRTYVWGKPAPGTVVGYFVEYGWFGLLLRVSPRNLPAWLRKQRREDGTPLDAPCHVFGLETD